MVISIIPGPSQATTSVPLPTVTCLFMVDSQSLGISQTAIGNYTKFFHFAIMVGDKLAQVAHFTGYIDTFGYGDPNDHEQYPVWDLADFDSLAYQTTISNTDIDLDLSEVDSSLKNATWAGSIEGQTCLVFISAAPLEMYNGTEISTTYDNFKVVVGAAINGATIPGLTDAEAVSELNDADAQSVVESLLEKLQK